MLPGAARGPPGLSRWVRRGTCGCTLGLRGRQGWKSAWLQKEALAGHPGKVPVPKGWNRGQAGPCLTGPRPGRRVAAPWRIPGITMCRDVTRGWQHPPCSTYGDMQWQWGQGHPTGNVLAIENASRSRITSWQARPTPWGAQSQQRATALPRKVTAELMLQAAPGAAQGCLLGKAGAAGSSSCMY